MSASTLPALLEIHLSDLTRLEVPSLRIRTDEDVVTWKTTVGYKNYLVFLRRLTESVVGHDLPVPGQDQGNLSVAVTSMLTLLDKLDNWIDEIPPLPTPQRFGNLAFRTWGKKLEDNADEIVKSLLPDRLHGSARLLKPYLIISFGSFTRMDYGTGHEAAFGILLLCLTLVRFFQPEPEEERNIVLVVFARYLRLCWKLQDVYKLEPAGSHGVWGLDDYSFLGYIFGSGQLRGQSNIAVSSVLRPPLPPTNLYFLSISRVHEVKSGPFHEHSSQLHAIATAVPNWGKVNSGLFKMYEAEVLGKRVVVQHIPVGGLLEWNETRRVSSFDAPTPTPKAVSSSGTRAPWASQVSNTGILGESSLPSTSTRTTIPGWSHMSTAGRAVDRTLLPPPVPYSTSKASSRPDVASVVSPSRASPSTRLQASSVPPPSLHSSAQRVQTNALTDGFSAFTDNDSHAANTRSSSSEEALG